MVIKLVPLKFGFVKKIPLEPTEASKKALGEEVFERLQFLNLSGDLSTPIDINVVAGPLSKMPEDTRMEIVELLEERGKKVEDPTAWICEASDAVPPAESEAVFDDEPSITDRAGSEKHPAEDSDGEAAEGAAAKRRRTSTSSPDSGAPALPKKTLPTQRVVPFVPAPGPTKAVGSKGSGKSRPFKTEICRRWAAGTCTFDVCTFAHGEDDIARPQNYKLRLCSYFLRGSCQAGENCNWAHGAHELRSAGGRSKAKVPWRPQSFAKPIAKADDEKDNMSDEADEKDNMSDEADEEQVDVEGDPPEEPTPVSKKNVRRRRGRRGSGVIGLADSRGKEQLDMTDICNYKTKLCETFEEDGTCPDGEDCFFAHGESEIRQPWVAPEDSF
eukprot:TRINITY_DN18882_c0_g1_i1.p1 TRINITY_DN18882_c0_g1~~TRINITY_DN18882_c0_g1_i1.p1  ORF type:complete len:386 (-),score=80.29 TRINITY_DN18882_c0_g1_i1:111-1268(-)